MSEPVRLNKHLAHTLGISRREADIAISQGRRQRQARRAWHCSTARS